MLISSSYCANTLPSRHTPDAEGLYRRTSRSCQIAVFMRNGTFYKGSR